MKPPLVQSYNEKLERVRAEEEERAAKLLAGRYKLPYIDLELAPISKDALILVPLEESREAELAVFQKRGMRIEIALHDPENPKARTVIESLTKKGFKPIPFSSSVRSLKRAWDEYPAPAKKRGTTTGEFTVDTDLVRNFQKQIRDLGSFATEVGRLGGSNISHLLELTFAVALNTRASDIHFEPEEDRSLIRLRIDGILQEAAEIPPRVHGFILSRIKLLSGLKLNIHTQALDGRFTITIDEQAVEIRVSILPSEYRESIALRILNPQNILSIEELGIRKDLQTLFRKTIEAPSGLILATGPTGAGKTTTLYACLKYLASPERKIITIEDPIEYRLPGVSQTQINPEKGYDFKNGLKHVLRQDPDVILVGEIRDLETAQTALNASLTGHLVFSTLHTNDAMGTIPRLIDMGAKPALFASATRLIIAERLVRRICKQCGRKRRITKKELALFENEFRDLPPSVKPAVTARTFILEPVRCSMCHNTGYYERIGVFEMLEMTDDLERRIAQNEPLPTLRETARKNGFITMKQDGLMKVIEGITTLEEVKRVLG